MQRIEIKNGIFNIIQLDNAEEYAAYVNDRIDIFVQSLIDKDFVIKAEDFVDEEDLPEGVEWVLSSRGVELSWGIEERFHHLGVKHFGEVEMGFVSVKCSFLREI